MDNMESKLRQLRDSDPDLALILDTFEEISRVYRETLRAMGATSEQAPEVMNSSQMMASFHSSSSTDYKAD